MSLPISLMLVSPTRAESIEAIQIASDEFRTQLFAESGIAWYCKQAEDCRKKVAQFLHVKLGGCATTRGRGVCAR